MRRRRARLRCVPTPPTCCRSSSHAASRRMSLTDQTSAHDPLNGYVPNGLSIARGRQPARTGPRRLHRAGDAGDRTRTCARCWRWRGVARSRSTTATTSARRREQAGVADAFEIPGFVPEYVRPLFCEGKGPFRWVALSGDPRRYRGDGRCRAGAVPARRRARPLDSPRAGARRVPGPARAHLLARSRRARASSGCG